MAARSNSKGRITCSTAALATQSIATCGRGVLCWRRADGSLPNSITAYGDLVASGMKIEKQAMLVNCPIVPPDSSLADNSHPLLKGWVNGQPVAYFDSGGARGRPA